MAKEATVTRNRMSAEDLAALEKAVLKAVYKKPANIHEIAARAGLCKEGQKLEDKTMLTRVRNILAASDSVVKEGQTRNTTYAKAAKA